MKPILILMSFGIWQAFSLPTASDERYGRWGSQSGESCVTRTYENKFKESNLFLPSIADG